jgi:hypothetical protein
MALWIWLSQNWPAVESLGRNLAADLAALWVLLVALATVLKPYFERFGVLQKRLLGIFKD